MLWLWDYSIANPVLFTPKLMNNRRVRSLSLHYESWVLLGVLLPGVIGGLLTLSTRGFFANLLLGGVIRLFLIQHFMFLVNSASHMIGTQPYRTGDQSRNNFWLVPFTLGAGWHNVHHAFPYTASNQVRWWYLDPGYWILRALRSLGLVWDLKLVGRGTDQRHLRNAGREEDRIWP